MHHYEEQLRSVVEAVEIRSSASFVWLGLRIQALPEPARKLAPRVRRRYLTGRLAEQLYRDFYQPGTLQPASSSHSTGRTDDPASRAFLQSIRAAHTLRETVAWGWSLTEPSFAIHGHMRLRIESEDVIEDDGDHGLRLRAERLGQSPGHYMVYGPAGFTAGTRFLRLYWNLTAYGAAPLLTSLTNSLTEAGVPFQFKTVLNPLEYDRADAAVLYLDVQDLACVAPRLREVHKLVSPYLREPVPALTKRIGYGLGLAEDPHDGGSFGIHRCAVIAEGLVAAWERGDRNATARLAAIQRAFEERGLDLATPYLNPGSNDDYETIVKPPGRSSRARDPRCDVTPDEALGAARSIGESLISQAIWHGDRCNWIGQAQPRSDFAPLGPDLYAGTSGVALFLADLHRATRDHCFLETALGAIRQALRGCDRLDDAVRLGLYTGIPGIALASQYVGRIAHDPEIERAGQRLLDTLALAQPASWDLLSGAAGAVVGLLIARRLDAGSGHSGDAARQLGAAILTAGQRDRHDSLAWPSDTAAHEHPLTGFAHGAAGIGHALLELGLTTSETRFVDGAWKAFAFERSWYDEAQQNWPDFRHVQSRAARPRGPLPTMTGWCHGAPGIALSRLRAYQVSSEPDLLSEIQAAIRTTAHAVETGLATGRDDSSLCHGLTGNAEILLLASEVVPLTSDTRRLIHQVARQQIDQLDSGSAWEAALSPMPGLMLGLAGRGRFLLRLARPEIPSILLPRPEDFYGYLQSGCRAPTLSTARGQLDDGANP